MSSPETTFTTADKPTKTSYLILVQDASKFWSEAGMIEASSADAAIRKHLGKDPKSDATVAAVPVRSFTKRTPRIITETRLVLE